MTGQDSLMTILLAEDDPGDQQLVRRVLDEGGVQCDLRIVQDGEEALDYLLHRGRYKDAVLYPLPDLLLLDLNMPKLDGREVLRQIADYPNLRRIATVVLTTSSQEQDILYSYDLGAKSYIAKPENLERYESVLRVLEHYWFHIVLLPPREIV